MMLNYRQVRHHQRAGEFFILSWFLETIIYEYLFDDLVSVASKRLVRKHPIFARVVIFAIAGHLAYVLPRGIDVFDHRNVVHKTITKYLKDHHLL